MIKTEEKENCFMFADWDVFMIDDNLSSYYVTLKDILFIFSRNWVFLYISLFLCCESFLLGV